MQGDGITLANNKIKDVVKVMRSLENTGIFLKGITEKVNIHEGGFLNFLKQLMSVGLPSIKNILTYSHH